MSIRNSVVLATLVVIIAYKLYVIANRSLPRGIENPKLTKLLDELGRMGNLWIQISEYVGVPANVWPLKQLSQLVFKFFFMYGREQIKTVRVSFDVIENMPIKIYRHIKNRSPAADLPWNTRPSNSVLEPTIIYFHGGGWAWMNLETYDGFLKYLAQVTKLNVIGVGYTQGTWNRAFPEYHENCLIATHEILKRYQKFLVNPKKVIVAGDGSGGNLAASVALRMRDKLRLQILINPSLQVFDFNLPSYIENADVLPGITSPFRELTHWLWYAGVPVSFRSVIKHNRHSSETMRKSKFSEFVNTALLLPPSLNLTKGTSHVKPKSNSEVAEVMTRYLLDTRFAPLMADSLEGVSPAYIITSQYDVLRDEGIMYSSRLREANINVELHHYNNSFHGFLLFAGNKLFEYPSSNSAMQTLVKFLRTTLL